MVTPSLDDDRIKRDHGGGDMMMVVAVVAVVVRMVTVHQSITQPSTQAPGRGPFLCGPFRRLAAQRQASVTRRLGDKQQGQRP